jgi:hypothetical protein
MPNNLLRNILRILFHTMPLLPAARGEFLTALAMVVVVALTYIKAKKYDAQLRYLVERNQREPVAAGAIAESRMVRNRWSWLTYLNWGDGQSPQSVK